MTEPLWDEALLASSTPPWRCLPIATPAEAARPRRRARLLLGIATAALAATGTTAVAAGVAPAADPAGPPLVKSGSTSPAVTARGPLPTSLPTDIEIPAIDVRARLQHLGLDRHGGLEVPAPGPRYNDPAWYRYSPTPGSLGPAIISGHVDSARYGRSVFFRLRELRPGDEITVRRADGQEARFAVDGVRVYAKDRFPTKLVYGDTRHAALRLLTCGGPFDRATGHYADNVIVFASLVGRRGVSDRRT
ncbi:MAG TPA: class F sortase [Acidimicrobiales bacterium]|nr:class F sortase [Acidimicrobiales bacterium]